MSYAMQGSLSRSGVPQYQPQGDPNIQQQPGPPPHPPGKADINMWQQQHYMGPDSGIQSGAATQAHSLSGHDMEDEMDTGENQVIFDMDQGFPQSGYTQEQVDEMNQQLNQTRSQRVRAAMFPETLDECLEIPSTQLDPAGSPVCGWTPILTCTTTPSGERSRQFLIPALIESARLHFFNNTIR